MPLQQAKIAAEERGISRNKQPGVAHRQLRSPVPAPIDAASRESCRSCAGQSTCLVQQLVQAIPAGANTFLFHSHVLQAGEHLFYAGDELTLLHVVKSGSCKIYTISDRGNEQVLAFQMPGDVLGVDALASHAHPSSAVALETTAVCTASLARIERLAERYSPGWLIGLLAGEVVREQRALLMITNKSAESRLAAFLLTLSERFAARGYSPRDFTLSMPRQDIANYLGLTVETISRTFTRLQLARMLEVNQRRVVIQDFAGLSTLAELQPMEVPARRNHYASHANKKGDGQWPPS